MNSGDGEFFIHGTQFVPHGVGTLPWVSFRADNEGHGLQWSPRGKWKLGRWKKHFGSCLDIQSGLLDICDHSDDFAVRLSSRWPSFPESLPNSSSLGPIAVSERLI